MKDIKPKGFAAELFEKNMNFLSSTYLTSSLAVLALLSAFKEVSESVEIGGHHGMVFLALHDIFKKIALQREREKSTRSRQKLRPKDR